MHGNRWSFVTSLTDTFTLPKYHAADIAPTSAVFEMDSALPVGMRLAPLEFGLPLPHANSRTKHVRSFLGEVARRAVEGFTAPRTGSFHTPRPSYKRLSGTPLIRTRFGAEPFPFWYLGSALFAILVFALSPSIGQVASVGTEPLITAILGAVLFAALFAVLSSISAHNDSISEISPEYCEIARKRLAGIDAQPTLFEPKPEQMTLGAQ